MNRYRRKPAAIVLLVSVFVGVVYVVAWGRIEQYLKHTGGAQTIESLEKRIADGDKSAGTWYAYGDALSDAREFSKAADAFKQVLAIEPFKREAKFQYGVCLAQASRGDELYNFLKDLVFSEAKLALELFDRPETQRYLSEERFSSLSKEAKNQAMD